LKFGELLKGFEIIDESDSFEENGNFFGSINSGLIFNEEEELVFEYLVGVKWYLYLMLHFNDGILVVSKGL
jgi:hypothetical protein